MNMIGSGDIPTIPLMGNPDGEMTLTTTLKIVEAGTPSEKATRKDLWSSNAPMVLWDYAIERRARIHNVWTYAILSSVVSVPSLW